MSAPLNRFCTDIPGVGLRRKNTKKDYCWGKMKKIIVPLSTHVTNEEICVNQRNLRDTFHLCGSRKNIRVIREIRGEFIRDGISFVLQPQTSLSPCTRSR